MDQILLILQFEGPEQNRVPQVGFVLQLSIERWNNKFFEVGCGGSCGSTLPDALRPLRRGYATLATTWVTRAGHRWITFSRKIRDFDFDRDYKRGHGPCLYPYPAWAVYKGRGNPNDAADFKPVKPTHRYAH